MCSTWGVGDVGVLARLSTWRSRVRVPYAPRSSWFPSRSFRLVSADVPDCAMTEVSVNVIVLGHTVLRRMVESKCGAINACARRRVRCRSGGRMRQPAIRGALREAVLSGVEPPSGFPGDVSRSRRKRSRHCQMGLRGRGQRRGPGLAGARGIHPDLRASCQRLVMERSLVAVRMGPSPTEPGECKLLLGISEGDWDDQVTTRYSMSALCAWIDAPDQRPSTLRRRVSSSTSWVSASGCLRSSLVPHSWLSPSP